MTTDNMISSGGIGISLTAANRVVLVDPDWNPQTDIQVSSFKDVIATGIASTLNASLFRRLVSVLGG